MSATAEFSISIRLLGKCDAPWRSRWGILALSVCLAACSDEEDAFPSLSELEQIRGLQSLSRPSPSKTNRYAENTQAAALGRALFFDGRLSSCNLSCAGCHQPPVYADRTVSPSGCNGEQVGRNTPTLLNTGFHPWHYWDGRKDSLWSHPILPLLRETEMAATPAAVRDLLQSDYEAPYTAIFGQAPSAEPDLDRVLVHFGKAMDAYLRTLVSVQSPFDTQLEAFIRAASAGSAVNEPLYAPLKTFVRKGRCVSCHKGPMLTDEAFHNIGLNMHGTEDRGRALGIELVEADRFNSASIYSDNVAEGNRLLSAMRRETAEETLGAFKTPTLRNVQLTAPYMHDGSLETLDDVIEFYNRGGDPAGTFLGKKTDTQVRLNLTDEEKRGLKEMLESMTGQVPP